MSQKGSITEESFYQILQIDLKSYECLSARTDDNRRVKETMLRCFKRVAILKINITQIEASVTLFAFLI